MMKLRLLVTLLFCWLGTGVCFGQVTKTLHQAFTLDVAEKVNINVVAKKIDVRETKGTRILVETKVTISLPNDRLLDFVCNSGRYNLSKTFDAATRELTLASKKTNNVIIVKGEQCIETLEYIIYMPSNIQYSNNSTLVESKE